MFDGRERVHADKYGDLMSLSKEAINRPILPALPMRSKQKRLHSARSEAKRRTARNTAQHGAALHYREGANKTDYTRREAPHGLGYT